MIAILQNIRSLHNVGSIFRTSDGAGVEKIYLCGITPTPVDKFGQKKAMLTKVSLGAEDSVPWEYVSRIGNLIARLKKQGYKIYALEQSPNSVRYTSAKPKTQKLALIVGNEVEGIPNSILKKVDKILEIPMKGKKESLNVSIAFGIVAFYLLTADEKND